MKKWPAEQQSFHWKRWLLGLIVLGVLCAAGWFVLRPHAKLRFDTSVSQSEQTQIRTVISEQKIKTPNVTITATGATELPKGQLILASYIVAANPYSPLTNFKTGDVKNLSVYVSSATPKEIQDSLKKTLQLPTESVQLTANVSDDLSKHTDAIGLIPTSELSPKVKLLRVNDHYLLDDFTSGAYFRTAMVPNLKPSATMDINHMFIPSKESVFKLNMSGVTAMTRQLMIKTQASKDPGYPAKNIGKFLSDADLTHTSDEVSFKEACAISSTSFCAPPNTIKTLEDSGVDIVELTGNHNNDSGTTADTNTINTFLKKGWHTFGGGLNSAEAAKPYVADVKQTQVAMFGYNYYDTMNPSEALASKDGPGANSFSLEKITSDIKAAKAKNEFVIVDLQYQECYAYPDGYVIFPECYKPIANPDQKTDFRKIIELGADMVIGTQAHQPQTFEIYKGKPIYYGLGNLFFDQVDWPGTEQGMILSHYFMGGKLLQTKLSPTVYDKAMQTRLMNETEAKDFLTLLNNARP